MCYRPQRTMYEGKNIHYSSSDNKLLCSFSGKLCNQRRLNGYGFCVRHILEDPTAPFKRCAYVAKSSNQMCTQAIPKHEERRYCNNHMQVLGMLPKKERKKKEKPPSLIESKPLLVSSGTVKAKFSLSSSKDVISNSPILKAVAPAEDPDDPYAFPDAGPSESKSSISPGNLPTSSDSILGKSLQSGQGFVRSASDISTTGGLGMSGGSMIAKYYPELAEKLEKMRAKPEPKTNAKSRSKSSRTMNKLQTKIAQNKINEKLRKSQELSQTDSNSSPLQLSSPEQNLGVEHSPSPGPVFSPSSSSHTFSPQASTPGHFPSNLILAGYEQGQAGQEVPPLPQVDTSFLATLAAQDNLGFQNSGVGESERLVHSHTPPRLPPPYPGSSTLSTPSSLTSSDLPAGAFSPQTNLNGVLESLSTSQSPQRSTITQAGPSGPSSLTSLPFTPPHPRRTNLQTPTPPPFLSPSSSTSSFPSSCTSNYPYPTSIGSSDHPHSGSKSLPNHSTSSLPPPNVDIFSLLNLNSKQLRVDPNTGLPQPQMLPSPNTLAAHLSLPPPPPYVPPVVPPKVTAAPLQNLPLSKITSSSSTHSSVKSEISVPHTKLRKLSGILSGKEAKRKLKSDLAVKFYSFYAKRKISNHCMVGPYLFSSDEDSEDEDIDLLPWQREIFSASSDEEADEEDGLENDVPMGMRPTKLSLLKTRIRRQWCQARNSYKSNRVIRRNNNQATLALIRTVRDSAACAVRALWQITHVKKSRRKLKKRKPKQKICCNKNEKEGQCQNQCLPYANHCVKHITYNINQQLFDFCTAKFANNVQCCLPSFDLRHELPLCQEHAAKADNYQKQLELENKKKPRKKSKPPALTRPPRKGKKKKKGRYARPQKPLPPAESVGLDSTLSDVDVTSIDAPKPEEGLEVIPSTSKEEELPSSVAHAQPAPLVAEITAEVKDPIKNLDHALELEETLSPDFDKPFELPLEQASRLLDESDFQEVVNKMPFIALDLFGKNGEPEPEPEAEHISIDLNSANKARDALEKLLTSNMSEEESMQLAMVLAQNLQTDAELAQNARLITETIPATTAHNDSRMLTESNASSDISMAAQHIPGMSGLNTSSHSGDHQLLSGQATGMPDSLGLAVSHSGLHPPQQQQTLHPQQAGMMPQSNLTSTATPSAPYGQIDNRKMNSSLHQQQTQQQMQTTTPSGSVEGMPPVLTADLNAVFGQIESLRRSELAARQSSGLNLNHITGLESFSGLTAKTVIRHLPSETQPISSVASSAPSFNGSPQGVYPSSPQTIGGASIAIAQVGSELERNVNLETPISTHMFNASSLPVINAQCKPATGPQHQNFTARSSSSSPSLPMSSSSLPSSMSSDSSALHSLSIPSRAKRAKLASPSKPQSVISHQTHTNQLQSPQLQQPQLQLQQHQSQRLPQPKRSTTVRHMLQPSSSSPPNSRLTLPDTNRNFRPQDINSPSSPQTLKPGVQKSQHNKDSATMKRRLTLPGVHPLQNQDRSKPNFSHKSPHTGDSGTLKLPTSNTLHSDSNQSRLNISDNSATQQRLTSSSPSFSSSSSFSRSSPKNSSTVRYSLTSDNLSSSLSSLGPMTTLRHNLLGDVNNVATESISVTVRHPSPLESIPTTVRHTLPDTVPSPMTLPSPPSLPLPSSASSSTTPSPSSQQSQDSESQSKLPPQTNALSQSSTTLHPQLQSVLSSSRPQWIPTSSLQPNLNIQNGLSFVSGGSRTQLTNKYNPAGQGNVRNKPNNSAAEAARMSALASAAGVPVVCSPVTLSGFVQGLSTTTFKSSGSS